MNALSIINQSMRPMSRFGILLSIALLFVPKEASAICGLDGAVRELMRRVANPDAANSLSQKTQLYGTCTACHLARFGGPRNEFGNAINTLLTLRDREDPVRQREVGQRIKDILANPSLPDSPTFGELFQLGRYPADSLVNKEPPLPEVHGRKPESLTAEQARELVTTTETQSRFGIVQLSTTSEITPEVAEVLASFRGDTLILGIKSLSPEVATELARYEGTLAFQGLDELPDASAEALASFSGPYLILSGPGAETLSPAAAESLARLPAILQIPLRHLDSVPLAERFTRQISWTLSNLETVSAPAARALTQYRQFFDVRALTTLESPEMARRFTEGTTGGSSITLPALSTLSPEAAEILASGSKPLYLGLTVIDSPAVALALAKTSNEVNLPRLRAATAEVITILAESKSLKMPSLDSIYVLPPSSDPPR